MKPFRYDTISNHIKTERLERFTYLMTEVGYNGIVYEARDEKNLSHMQHITDTGILFLTGKDNKEKIVLVTGFLLTIDKLTAIYKGEHIPQSLYNTVLRNQVKHKAIYTMKK